ncbi:MAG: HEAT repeat domain-containing protein [Phycisphaeraceae bacterium JB051]
MKIVSKLGFMTVLVMTTGMFVGCEVIDSTGSAIDNMISPPTPSEEARNVFNVYDPDIRRRALNNLSASPFGGEGPYVRLYRLLIDDPDPTVRAAAVKALGLHGEVKDVPLITIRLGDPADMVRWEASKALQKIHNPEAIKPLINAMNKDTDADVRMACADALGQYATPEVYGALVAALDDERYGVALAASESLSTITGQELGDQASAWIEYRESNGTNLFANQKTYMWQPYTPPRGFISKLQFWKKAQEAKPAQTPVGMDENAS